MTTRRTLDPVPSPANWFSVGVNSLTVYRTPQDDSYTHEVMVDHTNANTGQTEYTDGNGKGWYTPGEEPEGWTPLQVASTVLVPRTKRGEVSGVTIVEEDAEGNAIPRSTEGYAEFLSFNMNELREIAQANPATVGLAYNEAVDKLQALAAAICAAVNA